MSGVVSVLRLEVLGNKLVQLGNKRSLLLAIVGGERDESLFREFTVSVLS